MSTASIRRELINKEEGRMRNSPLLTALPQLCSMWWRACYECIHSVRILQFAEWDKTVWQNRTLLLACCNVISLLAQGETVLQADNVMGGRGWLREEHDTSILGFISKMRPFFLTTEPSCETYAQFMYRQHTLSDACIYPSTTGQFFLSVRLSLFIVTAGVYQLQWHTHKGIIPNTTCVCDREQQREFKPHCFVVVTNMCFKMLITWKGGTLTSPSFIVLVRSSDCDVVVSMSYHCWRME